MNLDSLRESIQNEKRKEDPSWKYAREKDEYEKKIKQIARQQIKEAIEEHRTIFLDNMNLRKNGRISDMKEMQQYAQQLGKQIRFDCVYFVPDLKQSLERISLFRTPDDVNCVSEGVIKESIRQLEVPTKDEGYSKLTLVQINTEFLA